MSTGPVVIGINPNKFVYNGKIMTAHVVPTIPDYYEKINFTELTTLAHSVDISLISDVKNVTTTGVAEYNDN